MNADISGELARLQKFHEESADSAKTSMDETNKRLSRELQISLETLTANIARVE